MTQTPILTGQDIGAAEAATRALLERMLARTGTGFRAWVALSLLSTSGAALGRDELAGRLVAGLKIAEAAAQAAVGELASHGLISQDPAASPHPQVTLTPAGAARYQQVRAGIGEIAGRLYRGLPAEDLATAHRVLATVTQRANAELAGPGTQPAA